MKCNCNVESGGLKNYIIIDNLEILCKKSTYHFMYKILSLVDRYRIQ